MASIISIRHNGEEVSFLEISRCQECEFEWSGEGRGGGR